VFSNVCRTNLTGKGTTTTLVSVYIINNTISCHIVTDDISVITCNVIYVIRRGLKSIFIHNTRIKNNNNIHYHPHRALNTVLRPSGVSIKSIHYNIMDISFQLLFDNNKLLSKIAHMATITLRI